MSDFRIYHERKRAGGFRMPDYYEMGIHFFSREMHDFIARFAHDNQVEHKIIYDVDAAYFGGRIDLLDLSDTLYVLLKTSL